MFQKGAKKVAGAALVFLVGILLFGGVLYGAGQIGITRPYRDYGHATRAAFNITTGWLGDASDAAADEVDNSVTIRSGGGSSSGSDLRAPAVGADPADAYKHMQVDDARLFQER